MHKRSAGFRRAPWAALLAACCLLPSDAAADRIRTPPDFFGVNGQQLRGVQQPGVLDQQVAQIAGLGIKWVRAGVPWSTLEPLPPQGASHAYSFGSFDTLVAALARKRLRLEPALFLTPGWAAASRTQLSCGADIAPGAAFYDDYGAAMAALAARYGANGSFWAGHPELPKVPVRQFEVWNEENMTGFWCPYPDPRGYASLVASASAAVGAVDPPAQIGVGGLATVKRTAADRMQVGDFLRRMVAARPELSQEVSVVFAHPYASTPEGVIGQLPWWRASIDAAGLKGKPLVTNEWGWYTRGQPGEVGPVSEAQRAADFDYVANRMSRTDCGVAGTAPYTWLTPEVNPTNKEDWFGVASAAAAGPYPSALAYGGQIALFLGRAEEPPPTDVLRLCGPPCALTAFAVRRRRSAVVLRFNARRPVLTTVIAKKRKRRHLRRVARTTVRIPAGRSHRRWSGRKVRRRLPRGRAYRLAARVRHDSVGCEPRLAKLKRGRRQLKEVSTSAASSGAPAPR